MLSLFVLVVTKSRTEPFPWYIVRYSSNVASVQHGSSYMYALRSGRPNQNEWSSIVRLRTFLWTFVYRNSPLPRLPLLDRARCKTKWCQVDLFGKDTFWHKRLPPLYIIDFFMLWILLCRIGVPDIVTIWERSYSLCHRGAFWLSHSTCRLVFCGYFYQFF